MNTILDWASAHPFLFVYSVAAMVIAIVGIIQEVFAGVAQIVRAFRGRE